MQRLALGLLFATTLTTAAADGVLLGRHLIDKGDSIEQVRAAAGEPTRLDRIDGDEYSPAMEIWTYRFDDKTVNLWFVGNNVVKAAEERVAGTGGNGASPRGR